MGKGGHAAAPPRIVDSVESHKRQPTSTIPFTIKDLRQAIPQHCFERSLLRSSSYLACDLIIAGFLFWGSSFIGGLPVQLCFGEGVAPRRTPAPAWSCEGPPMWARLCAERSRARLYGSVTSSAAARPCAETGSVRVCAYSRSRTKLRGWHHRADLCHNDAAWSCIAVTPVQPCACTPRCAEPCLHDQVCRAVAAPELHGGVQPSGA